MRILLVVLIFFVLGALFIISNNGLTLYNDEDFSDFSELYVLWLDSTYSNVQKVTGNAVKLDWLPELNNTLNDKQKP